MKLSKYSKSKIMTLQEHLKRCDFKNIAPFIKEYYPEEAVNMYSFKEAFDILRHLEPKLNPDYPSYQEINITKKLCEEFDEDKARKGYYIRVNGGDLWESDLAKEVVMSDDLTLSNEEIAAHCLWELTFFGNPFNKEEHERKKERYNRNDGYVKHYRQLEYRKNRKPNSSNPYTVAMEKLDDKLRLNYYSKWYRYAEHYTNNPGFLKGKFGKETPYFDCFPTNFGLENGWLKPDPEKETRRNRSKRMRDHRQEKRIKKLKRMAKVENNIRRLLYNTKSFTRAELNCLFDSKLMVFEAYCSHSHNVSQRIDYLIDMFTNYEPMDFSEFTHFILSFRTSSEHPLTQTEWTTIQNYFKQRLPSAVEIRYGQATDETLGTEICLLLVGSC